MKEEDIPPTLLATRFICSEENLVLVICRMIFISMMLKANLVKKILQVVTFQVGDIIMEVQLLEKSCTSLVEMKIMLQEITLFTL